MKKILYVEDYEMGRDILSRRLTRKGFNCICAADGGQAIEMAGAEQPDLILIDIYLPFDTAWITIKQIRDYKDTKHIPIIALTDYALNKDRDRALEVGCEDYTPKPIELPKLLEKVTKLLAH
ncbi:response regulator [Candidatus Albibeggiatoa sp. nov. BB20]|uniref:response regulator n=1 Tax=Candidatus Albibeggiatoa sp. nov. BB20 TaxID=3162723 RepID=UPI003365793D